MLRIAIIQPVQGRKPSTDTRDWAPDKPFDVLMDGLSPHDRSRSYLISRALIEFPEAEAFLWVDDDTEATLEQAEALASTMEADGSDLVTGVYVCRHAAERGRLALNFNARFNGEHDMTLAFGESGGPYPIVACGFGFVLTHRRMFERSDAQKAKYTNNEGETYRGRAYFLPLVHDEEHLGEDRSFSLRNQGARMLVDTRVCVGHAGHTLESVLRAIQ